MTHSDGCEGWNFEEWLKQNELASCYDVFDDHAMNTLSSLTLCNAKFVSIITDPRVVNDPSLPGKIVQAMQSLEIFRSINKKNKDKTKLIFINLSNNEKQQLTKMKKYVQNTKNMKNEWHQIATKYHNKKLQNTQFITNCVEKHRLTLNKREKRIIQIFDELKRVLFDKQATLIQKITGFRRRLDIISSDHTQTAQDMDTLLSCAQNKTIDNGKYFQDQLDFCKDIMRESHNDNDNTFDSDLCDLNIENKERECKIIQIGIEAQNCYKNVSDFNNNKNEILAYIENNKYDHIDIDDGILGMGDDRTVYEDIINYIGSRVVNINDVQCDVKEQDAKSQQQHIESFKNENENPSAKMHAHSKKKDKRKRRNFNKRIRNSKLQKEINKHKLEVQQQRLALNAQITETVKMKTEIVNLKDVVKIKNEEIKQMQKKDDINDNVAFVRFFPRKRANYNRWKFVSNKLEETVTAISNYEDDRDLFYCIYLFDKNTDITKMSKFKTQPCSYWSEGNCPFGDRCRYIHDPDLYGGTKGKQCVRVSCYNCGTADHFARECPFKFEIDLSFGLSFNLNDENSTDDNRDNIDYYVDKSNDESKDENSTDEIGDMERDCSQNGVVLCSIKWTAGHTTNGKAPCYIGIVDMERNDINDWVKNGIYAETEFTNGSYSYFDGWRHAPYWYLDETITIKMDFNRCRISYFKGKELFKMVRLPENQKYYLMLCSSTSGCQYEIVRNEELL